MLQGREVAAVPSSRSAVLTPTPQQAAVGKAIAALTATPFSLPEHPRLRSQVLPALHYRGLQKRGEFMALRVSSDSVR